MKEKQASLLSPGHVHSNTTDQSPCRSAIRFKTLFVMVLTLLVTPARARIQGSVIERDVVVYSATPAGFAAALAAKAIGAGRVLLVEPTSRVGGMASPGGIGLRDCDKNEIRTNNSTQYTWAMLNAKFYGVSDPVWQPDAWVGQLSFLQMLKDYDVELMLNTNFIEGSEGVETEQDNNNLRRITAIHLESGETVTAKYFIDASYEGELMMATGYVKFTYGRESNETWKESYGGISRSSLAQFKGHINPYYHDDTDSFSLLKWIQNPGPDPRAMLGKSDQNVMAYSFRACLSEDYNNQVPFPKPDGYDPMDFELSRRSLQKELNLTLAPSMPWGNLVYHGYPSTKAMKYDACCGYGPVGIDAVGLADDYPVASRARRKEIYNQHKYYVQGLMWFWANDPAVPKDVLSEMNKKGLCKDEWPDNDHFPPQLYVREAVRIVGDRVFTQCDHVEATKGGCKYDSIALGVWGFDVHEMQRVVVEDGDGIPYLYNEGLTSPGTGGAFVYEIPYYVLLPARNQMVNLLVPNCPSVTHVALSAMRVEPTLWQMGQAAGTATAIAMTQYKQYNGTVPLQDIDIRRVQDSLLEQQTFIHWEPASYC